MVLSYPTITPRDYLPLRLLFEMFYPKDEMETIHDEWEMDEFEERRVELAAERYYDRQLPFDNINTLEFILGELKTLDLLDKCFQIFNSDRDSLLTIACREGVHEKIKLLLVYGVDPESVPEINFKSRLVLQEVQDKIRREEKQKWTFLLTYMTQEINNETVQEELISKDSSEIIQQLGTIHKDTLLGMILPFL